MTEATFYTRHKTRIAYAVLAVGALLLASQYYLVSHVPGVEIAKIRVPGTVEVDLAPGDSLAFTLDASPGIRRRAKDRMIVRADSNLATCVESASDVTVHVWRDAAE